MFGPAALDDCCRCVCHDQAAGWRAWLSLRGEVADVADGWRRRPYRLLSRGRAAGQLLQATGRQP